MHNTVLNIALSYLTARTAPAIGVHSPPSVLDPTPANPGDIIAYASLETLFGSMDFCACDHYRSVLSPAAYLVDLLQFLGSDDDVWKRFRHQLEIASRRARRRPIPISESSNVYSGRFTYGY